MPTETCYCCDRDATSKEHVPAKAFFPEQKYLPKGCTDLRKNLITVPSCEYHNTNKSGDDEFYGCLTAMIADSYVASEFFAKKWIKALTRNGGSLAKRMFHYGLTEVQLQTGDLTAGFEIDREEFDEYFMTLTRALYYSESGTKLHINDGERGWSIIPVFVFNKDLSRPYDDINIEGMRRNFISLAQTSLAQYQIKGENIDVFWFQRVETDSKLIYRYMFYGVAEFFVIKEL